MHTCNVLSTLEALRLQHQLDKILLRRLRTRFSPILCSVLIWFRLICQAIASGNRFWCQTTILPTGQAIGDLGWPCSRNVTQTIDLNIANSSKQRQPNRSHWKNANKQSLPAKPKQLNVLTALRWVSSMLSVPPLPMTSNIFQLEPGGGVSRYSI